MGDIPHGTFGKLNKQKRHVNAAHDRANRNPITEILSRSLFLELLLPVINNLLGNPP